MKNQKYTFLALILVTGLAMIAADCLILLFFENTFSHCYAGWGNIFEK
jgi:hypothetical protein